MKDIHVLAIVVRLFALFLAVNALTNGFEMIYSLNQQGSTNFSFLYIVHPLLTLLLSVYLWFLPMTVAKGIMPYKNDKNINLESISYQHLFTLAITVLGVYFLFDSMVNMFYWMYLWITSFNSSQVPIVISPEQKAGAFATVLELLLSVILIVGAKKISAVFKISNNIKSKNL